VLFRSRRVGFSFFSTIWCWMIYDQRDLDFHVMWKCCTHRVVSIGLLLLVVSLLRLFNGMNRIIAFTYTRKAKSTATAAKNERSFFPPARKILNSSCNRYSHMLASSGAGMGHKFGEVVLGMMLAQMTNSTFVYDSKTWNVRGDHGGYEWFPEFLPLEETAVTLTDLETNNFSLLEVDDNFLNLLSRSKGEFKDSCNIIFITSWPKCDGSCFQSSHTGSYNAAKWRLREVHSRSKFEPSNKIFKNLTSQGILSVAWHLRGGDIVLHSSEDFYKNLASELMSVLFDFSYHIFFLESISKNLISYPTSARQSFLIIALTTTMYPMPTLFITLWLLTFWWRVAAASQLLPQYLGALCNQHFLSCQKKIHEIFTSCQKTYQLMLQVFLMKLFPRMKSLLRFMNMLKWRPECSHFGFDCIFCANGQNHFHIYLLILCLTSCIP